MTVFDVVADRKSLWIVCSSKKELAWIIDTFGVDCNWRSTPDEIWEKYGSNTALNIKDGSVWSHGSKDNLTMWEAHEYYTLDHTLYIGGLNSGTKLVKHKLTKESTPSIDERIAELEKELAELKEKKNSERDKEFRSLLLAINAFNEKHGEAWELSTLIGGD